MQTITANGVDNKGTIGSQQQLELRVRDRLNVAGSLLADGPLTVQAGEFLLAGSASGKQGVTLDHTASLKTELGSSLLSDGNITLNADDVRLSGLLSSEQGLSLEAQKLLSTAGARTQSKQDMKLKVAQDAQLAGVFNTLEDLKFSAATADNSGEIDARNIDWGGDSLKQRGHLKATENATLKVKQLDQQGDLLADQRLDLRGDSLVNSGLMGAQTLDLVLSESLNNTGNLHGVQKLALQLAKDLTNATGGKLLSEGELTAQAATVNNSGLWQGDRITLTARQLDLQLINSGNLMAGGALSLQAPTLNNSGLLQADSLTFTGTTLDNSGTLSISGDNQLTLDTLNNKGTLQGGNLKLKADSLDNTGTLLATSQMSLKARQIDNQNSGKLLSSGDISLDSTLLNQYGQLVALGNMTLTLKDAFTQSGTLAVGKALALTSDGDILLQGTTQGQSVDVRSGGQLSNAGSLRGGSGEMRLEAAGITQNAAASLQSGGLVQLLSRGDISNNGFIGTAGTLLLSAANSLLNSSMLYAGVDMKLLADRITNQRGDILAANKLWMQKDADGNTNSQIVNTSGTIETETGDIQIKTAHLLNQRDGLKTSVTQEDLTKKYDWLNGATASIPLSFFNDDEYGYYTVETMRQMAGDAAREVYKTYTYASPYATTKEQALSTSKVTVSSSGGAHCRRPQYDVECHDAG